MTIVAAPVPSIWLTPRPGRAAPVHRWFVFPHSFAPELVDWLLGELGVELGSTILDPFCGAGTTLVEAQKLGHHSVGVDLLPLAVLASSAKTQRPSARSLRRARERAVAAASRTDGPAPKSPLLERAFSPESLARMTAALRSTRGQASACVRLAVLSIAPRLSGLVADGGWLRETEPELHPSSVPDLLDGALQRMEADLQRDRDPTQVLVHSADARCLPVLDGAIDVVITSPPYPNRHDYTRVFAVELELGFGLGEAVLNLRRQAVHSHPEAMPERPLLGYAENLEMARPIRELWAQHPDPRVARMLSGYLNDMHDVLVELRRVLRPGGRAALVVGNVRYCGIEIPVDDWIAELGTRAGFRCLDVRALRFRGNSAQQMALFGRSPSRESAVLLERP